MKRLLQAAFASLFLVFAAASGVQAQTVTVIAETSFEDPAAVGGQYTDTGDPLVDHDLVNNTGEPLVDFTPTGSELGFDSRYVNTRGSSGLTDGDFVGVTAFTGDVGNYEDGAQGFQISDPDGKMITEIDPVDLTGTTLPYVAVRYFINDTGYESTDSLRISVKLSGGDILDLVALDGDDIDADDGASNANEGQWLFAQQDLSSYVGQSATLVFAVDTNSSTESVYFDQVEFSSDGALPVELTAFNVTVSENTASLDWRTASEQNNAGFEVQHKAAGSTTFARAGFVDGNGTTTQPQAYRFEVSGLTPGTHTFRLKQVDFDGTESFSPAQEVTVRTGETLAIQGPNPMRGNQQARLVVQVDAEQPVDVALYNVLGQRVATLFTGTAAPQAPAEATLSTDRLASGVYFVRVVGASVQATEQITVVR